MEERRGVWYSVLPSVDRNVHNGGHHRSTRNCPQNFWRLRERLEWHERVRQKVAGSQLQPTSVPATLSSPPSFRTLRTADKLLLLPSRPGPAATACRCIEAAKIHTVFGTVTTTEHFGFPLGGIDLRRTPQVPEGSATAYTSGHRSTVTSVALNACATSAEVPPTSVLRTYVPPYIRTSVQYVLPYESTSVRYRTPSSSSSRTSPLLPTLPSPSRDYYHIVTVHHFVPPY